MSKKNSLTPAGIEPATFRIVAQQLNHCAIAVPYKPSCITQLTLKRVLLSSFFWVIPRRLNFICRRFGTCSLFYLHRSCKGLHYQYRCNGESVSERRTKNSDAGKSRKRKSTTFTTRRKLEIKIAFHHGFDYLCRISCT